MVDKSSLLIGGAIGAAAGVLGTYFVGVQAKEKENLLGWRLAIEYASYTKNNTGHAVPSDFIPFIVSWIEDNGIEKCKAEWTRLVGLYGISTYIKLPW